MNKYLVTYTEIFTGQVEVEANNEEMANDRICEMIDSGELDPTKDFSGHNITVNLAKGA